MELSNEELQKRITRKSIQIRTIRYISAKISTFFREALEKENLELRELEEKDRAKNF